MELSDLGEASYKNRFFSHSNVVSVGFMYIMPRSTCRLRESDCAWATWRGSASTKARRSQLAGQ